MEQERQTLMGAFQRTHGSPQSIRQTMTMMAPKMKQHLESMGPQSDVKKEQASLMMLEAFQHPPGVQTEYTLKRVS
jgi:hypothetical protein